MYSLKGIVICFFICFRVFALPAQDVVFILTAMQEVYKVHLADCEPELITPLVDPQNNTPFVSNDIAYGSDSMLYVIGGAGLFRIDPQSGEITFVTPTPGVALSVGLFGTMDGQLISIGAFGDVHIVDIESGVVTFEGNSGLTPGGDITFYKGELYVVDSGNQLWLLDLNDVANPVLVTTAPGPVHLGMTTLVESCNEQTLVLTTVGDIITFDPESGESLTLCADLVPPFNQIYGAAAENAPLAQTYCSIIFDLDADNSSGAGGTDFNAGQACDTASFPLADEDCLLESDHAIDSIQVMLTGVLDAPSEFITIPSSPGFVVNGNGTASVTILNPDTLANQLLCELLSESQYVHTGSASPGVRTVAITPFSTGNAGPTAHMFAELIPAPDAGSDEEVVICPNDTVNLQSLLPPFAEPGGVWLNSEGVSVSPVVTANSGSLTYQVENEYCSSFSVWTISQGEIPSSDFITSPPTCPDSCDAQILILPSPGTVVQFNGSIAGGIIENLCPGLYNFSLLSDDGCSANDSVIVDNPEISADIIWPETICLDEPTVFEISTSAQWEVFYNGEPITDSVFTPNATGIQCITLIEINGCTELEFCTEVVDCSPSPPSPPDGLYIPNAFTPDGDGINDLFGVVSTLEFERFELSIYNRLGQLMFNSVDPDEQWRGNPPGSSDFVSDGVYVWVLAYRVSGDIESAKLNGFVTVLR
ncbi:MAG: hypothetical protein EA392_12575 [Cryomorphaceae bacterium]|nr:MAG: hypothetical protein EA392_12575 [Cryomorphaceae bacterium]